MRRGCPSHCPERGVVANLPVSLSDGAFGGTDWGTMGREKERNVLALYKSDLQRAGPNLC